MSNKRLAVLGIVAVMMVGFSFLQNRIRHTVGTPDFSSSPLIEGLQVETVAAITITHDRGEQTTTLSRMASGFVVTDKDNYPADVAAINTLLNQCLDIRTLEEITDNPDNHADLKVTPQTAHSVVSFLDGQGREIVAVVVSPSDEKGGAFVRRLSSNTVYSIQYAPRINTDAMSFVDAQLLQLAQEQLASVAVRTGDESYVLAASEDKQTVQLQNLPTGKQLKGADYKQVFGAMSSLQFDDVKSAKTIPDALKFDSSYTCKLDDQTVYKLSLAKKDDAAYAILSASFVGQTPTKEQGVESEEQLKEKEAILLTRDAVKVFNQQHKGWLYRIPSPKSDTLMKPLSELIEDIPEPEPETTPEADSGDA